MSSIDIFSDGTSMTTPFTLCKRSTPFLKPRNAASTRNCPERSRHSRVWLESGGAPRKRCENEIQVGTESTHVSQQIYVRQNLTWTNEGSSRHPSMRVSERPRLPPRAPSPVWYAP